MVVWLIGLSGSGKTTLSKEILNHFGKSDPKTIIVDGDIVREIFGNDLGHTMKDRKKNADRISILCKFLNENGINVICSILSLFHESQKWNRAHINNYFQIYIRTSIEAVIERDVKGIYKRFKKGEISHVAGMDMEFPNPTNNDLVIDNNKGLKSLLEFAPQIAEIIKNG